MDNNKKSKFDSDDDHEPISDLYIYFPLSDILNPIFHKLGFKPNHITILSSISTLYSIYCFSIRKKSCFFYYFLGYLFDSMDGRMARKYNQGSTLGMMLDLISDSVTLIPLYCILLSDTIKSINENSKDKTRKVFLIILMVFLTYFLSLTYGINEAILSYKSTKSDNFYLYKEKIIKESEYNNTPIGKIFLYFIKGAYKSYRRMFPEEINDNNINVLKNKLIRLKEFGPGNYNLFMLYIMVEFF